MVRYKRDGGEKGRNGRRFERDEKVSRRVGDLSNRKLFLYG